MPYTKIYIFKANFHFDLMQASLCLHNALQCFSLKYTLCLSPISQIEQLKMHYSSSGGQANICLYNLGAVHFVYFYWKAMVREAKQQQKSVSVWFLSKWPWPPRPCVFGLLKGKFKKPFYLPTKVPQSVWILIILPICPCKMSKTKFLIIFGIR